MSQTAASPAPFYRPELDGLRFFAFLAVFVHHAFPQEAAPYVHLGLSTTVAEWSAALVQAGGYGVSLFFLLSSYLITELLLREQASGGRIAVGKFYARRALRIWPLYFLFVTLVILLGPRLVGEEPLSWRYIAGYFTFTGNWTVAALGYPSSVTAPLWSISIEEQFYLVWPLLVIWATVTRLRMLSCALLVLAVLVRLGLTATGARHPALWCNTFAQLDPIAFGALVACSFRGAAPQLGAVQRALLAFLGVALLGCSARWLGLDGWGANLAFPLLTTASLFVLVAAVGAGRTLSNPVLVYLGRISYGLYVLHVLAIKITDARLRVPLGLSQGRAIVVSLALTILLAALSYALVEKPFLRLTRHFSAVGVAGHT